MELHEVGPDWNAYIRYGSTIQAKQMGQWLMLEGGKGPMPPQLIIEAKEFWAMAEADRIHQARQAIVDLPQEPLAEPESRNLSVQCLQARGLPSGAAQPSGTQTRVLPWNHKSSNCVVQGQTNPVLSVGGYATCGCFRSSLR